MSTKTIAFCTAIFLSFVLLTDISVPGETKATARFAFAGERKSVLAEEPEISFTVSMAKPWTHLLEVEMRVRWSQMPERLELKMPVWTPGSYLIREYSRHVQGFSARGADGRELVWQKVNKNTWQVNTAGGREAIIRYAVYANELTVRTNELNDQHAFWNNAALLMFPKDKLNAPSTIQVVPYGNWKVATGLPQIPGQKNTYRAANFDILYDSPFEVSDFREISFTAGGKPHRFVVTGDGNYDLRQMADDTKKIVEESAKIFGELPPDDYLFILNLRGGGGLEHLNSTALQWTPFGFKPHSSYVAFLGLVTHENFHLWNVKRIRPDALGPFDYENENYTRLLWVAEGGTSYYEGVILRRTGFISDREYWSTKASAIEQLQNRPGRFETSLEEASFDAWIKFYRPDENAINNQISYYDKGEIVNMLLDIVIRTSSDGAKSLDDVMRHLYDEFYRKNRNYTPGDYQRVCEMMAGKSLDDFFTKYVRGRSEIDYNSILSGIGLQLVEFQPGEDEAYLGAGFSESGGGLAITSLPAGTPAYEQGLNTGDLIFAVDGYRASGSFLRNYIAQKKPGESIRLTLFRFDRLREITIKLGSNTQKSYDIQPVSNPSEVQKRLYQEYMKAEL